MHQSKPQIAQYSQMKQNLQLKTKQHIAGEFPTIMIIHTRNLWNYFYVKYLHAVFNAIYLISCGHISAVKIIRDIWYACVVKVDREGRGRRYTGVHLYTIYSYVLSYVISVEKTLGTLCTCVLPFDPYPL